MATQPLHQINTHDLDNMQKEFRSKYDQRMHSIQSVFKQCMDDMKIDYDQHMKQINDIHSKIRDNNA